MTALERFQNNRNALGWAFMLPATVLLLLFLTYPLGLGTWLGFTDAKVGRDGEWIALENFSFLVGDSVTRLALFNTLFYTVIASILKFGLGLWLAILLNKNLPFKSFFRAVVLLPWIVPTALSAKSTSRQSGCLWASSRALNTRPSSRRWRRETAS